MNSWLIELRGHEIDLKNLAELFTAPDCRVFAENGDFRLASTAFDALADDLAVYNRSKSLIIDINGIGAVYVDGYRNVSLSGGVISVNADGTRKRCIYEAVTLGIRCSGSADATGGIAMPKGSTPADNAIKAALDKEVVSRALGFFSQEKNWFNLYKVLDVIGTDMGKDAFKQQQWVSSGEVDRFTGTANSHEAAGGEARHGYLSKKKMKKKPMTLAEGGEFIRTLLREWLKSKE